MTTNSAGLSGAKPTTMLTMPRLTSSWVVVSASHLTKYASRGVVPGERALPEEGVQERADVEPDLRPERRVVGLEDHPLRAAVEATPRGTARCGGPARTSTRRRARRRPPACARPTPREPTSGKVRRQLTPIGLRLPVLAVGQLSPSARATPATPASSPGRRLPDAARRRPCAPSRPATAPLGGKSAGRVVPAAGRAPAGTGSRAPRSCGRRRRS